MYDDGKKSILSNIFYSILWLLGLALLIYLVYRIGFAPLFGKDYTESLETAEAESVITTEADVQGATIEGLEIPPDNIEVTEPVDDTEVIEATEDEVPSDDLDEDAARINEILSGMSLEEKVAQLFFITPEQLTGVDNATVFGDMSVSAYTEHPVGGLIYFAKNFESPDQTAEMLQKANDCAKERLSLPLFIGVDEEGGRILRLADNPAFNLEKTKSMVELSAEGTEDAVYHAADQIGQYLKEYGFNVDFAPVADVITEPENNVIGDRSFGDDAALVSKLSADYAGGLHNNDILACYKHFPGHGSTKSDSHDGYASSERTIEELRSTDLIPFIGGIENGTDFIMVGHISFPNIPETNNLPATLSPYMVTELLRNELGYDGIIITDALNMGAINNDYDGADASVLAFEAGCDMLMMPADFETAYSAVLDKIKTGGIPEERLNESVYRIIRAKLNLMQ